MTNCTIWFVTDGVKNKRIEIYLNPVPRKGDLIKILENDDLISTFIVTEVVHFLVRQNQKWFQETDVYLMPNND